MQGLPEGENVQTLDAAFASANKGRHIEIPTAVGFCMYIRRHCLNEVGLFDVESFGKGYGEENDFCLKATAKGWKHLLAADTFVFHEGGVSFQAESNPRKKRAMNILRQRYPNYKANVKRHIAKNEAYPFIVAATAARYKQAGIPVVLHVLHAYGGGTQKHVEELCRALHGKVKQLVMSPSFLESGGVYRFVLRTKRMHWMFICRHQTWIFLLHSSSHLGCHWYIFIMCVAIHLIFRVWWENWGYLFI